MEDKNKITKAQNTKPAYKIIARKIKNTHNKWNKHKDKLARRKYNEGKLTTTEQHNSNIIITDR